MKGNDRVKGRPPNPLKLLIVDDNPKMRGLIASLVSPFAEEVRECGDGALALPVFAEMRPDVVLMDLLMERMNGLEATRRILATDAGATVIIVTECDDEGLRQAALEAGARDFACKSELTRLIARLKELASAE